MAKAVKFPVPQFPPPSKSLSKCSSEPQKVCVGGPFYSKPAPQFPPPPIPKLDGQDTTKARVFPVPQGPPPKVGCLGRRVPPPKVLPSRLSSKPRQK